MNVLAFTEFTSLNPDDAVYVGRQTPGLADGHALAATVRAFALLRAIDEVDTATALDADEHLGSRVRVTDDAVITLPDDGRPPGWWAEVVVASDTATVSLAADTSLILPLGRTAVVLPRGRVLVVHVGAGVYEAHGDLVEGS